MVRVYLDRGCGPWVLLGLWNTLYQLLHVPTQLAKATATRVRAEFDPLKVMGDTEGSAPLVDDDEDKGPPPPGSAGDGPGGSQEPANPSSRGFFNNGYSAADPYGPPRTGLASAQLEMEALRGPQPPPYDAASE